MATPFPIASEPPTVVLIDGVVIVTELEESDPVVVDLVREAEDAEGAIRSALNVGARAIRAAGVNVDTDVIDRRFTAMAEQMDQQLDTAVSGLSDAIEAAVAADGGAIPAVLDKHRDDLETMLGSTFDPNSKTSVLALIEDMLEETRRSQVEAVADLVTIDGDDSPLARLRAAVGRDMKTHLKEQLDGVRDEVRLVSERVAVNDAIAPVVAITTAKGFTFEDVLHAHIEAVAAAHGDLAEQTGTMPGVCGTKKGDEIVTLNRDDTNGIELRIVLEAKSTKLSMRKAHDELDAAIDNRDAAAGILVFTSAEQAPTNLPFSYADNRAIVVLDEDGTDDGALRLAYMWARWVARRSLTGSEADQLDLERIASLIDRARTALGRVKTIRANHSKATKAIELAGSEVTRLNDDVEASLAALEAELEP